MKQFQAKMMASLALLVSLVSPASAQPTILDQVPNDAVGYVAVANLGELNKKVAQLRNDLQLPLPPMNDVLGMAQQQLGIKQGLDTKGAMAAVVTAINPQTGPSVVVLLPITDEASFLGNFNNPTPTANDPTMMQVQSPAAPMPLFVKIQGKLAMISNEQAPIAAYRPGKQADHLAQAGPLGANAMKRGDVIAFINLEKLAPMLQGFVAMGMMQAQQNMAMMPDEGGMRDLSMAMMKMYGDIANGYLRDAKGLTFTARVNQNGLDLSSYTQFKDGSYAAKLFPNATGDSLKLDRLPAKPYLYATAMDLGHMPLEQVTGDIKAKLDQAVPADSEAQPIIQAYKAALDTIGSGLGNSQQAWFSPDMAGGPADPSKLFNITSVYTTDEPEQMLKAIRQYIQSVGMAMNSQAQAAGMQMPMTVEYKANVVEVDGKPVDQYKMELNIANNPMFQADPSAQMVMAIMSGAMQGYLLPTDNSLIIVQGKGQVDMLGQVLAVGGQARALESDADFSRMRADLDGYRFSEAYLNVGQGLEVALGYANMMAAANGMNLPPIAVPAKLPPVAMSASSQEGGVGMHLHVPMKTATAVKDVVMQGVAAVQMGGMGGGMGGGGQPQPMNNQPEPAAPEDTQAVEPAGDGEVIDLTADNFDEKVLARNGVVLVDFWASWSAPCRRQAPIVDGLADTFADRATVGRVNADEDSKLANQYNVRAIPTIILFKNGKEIERFQGLTEKDKLAEAIRKAAGPGR